MMIYLNKKAYDIYIEFVLFIVYVNIIYPKL